MRLIITHCLRIERLTNWERISGTLNSCHISPLIYITYLASYLNYIYFRAREYKHITSRDDIQLKHHIQDRTKTRQTRAYKTTTLFLLFHLVTTTSVKMLLDKLFAPLWQFSKVNNNISGGTAIDSSYMKIFPCHVWHSR